MIAALSPAAINYDETLSTLRFAQNVSAITTKASANVDEEAATIQKLKDEIAELKARIEHMKSSQRTDEEDEKVLETEEAMCKIIEGMQEWKKSEEELMQEREEMDKKRQEALHNAGLSSSIEAKAAEAVGQGITLMNISDDPSISNMLVYSLAEGKNLMGTDPSNGIVLKGLGIGEKHAVLHNSKNDHLFVEPLDPDTSKVSINGKQIYSKTEIKHLDRLIFGHGNAFKVVIASQADKGEAPKAEETNDYTAILQDRLANDTPEAKSMRKYLEELRERLGEKKGMQFVRMFQQALDELDEANEYSKARYIAFPLDKNYVCFTIEVMIDMRDYDDDEPELAFRCRHRRTNEVMFLWSYEKFKQRLELMAEWYADLKDDGMLNKDYFIDPWLDVSDEDIKRKVEEQKDMTADKIKKLKARLEEEKANLANIIKRKDALK